MSGGEEASQGKMRKRCGRGAGRRGVGQDQGQPGAVEEKENREKKVKVSKDVNKQTTNLPEEKS